MPGEKQESEHVRANDVLIMKLIGKLEVTNTNLEHLITTVSKHEDTLHGQNGTNGVCGTLKTHAEKLATLEKNEVKNEEKTEAHVTRAVDWVLGAGMLVLTLIQTAQILGLVRNH